MDSAKASAPVKPGLSRNVEEEQEEKRIQPLDLSRGYSAARANRLLPPRKRFHLQAETTWIVVSLDFYIFLGTCFIIFFEILAKLLFTLIVPIPQKTSLTLAACIPPSHG